MNNRSPGTSNLLLMRKVKIYDVAKKKLIAEFESGMQAAAFLGINSVNPYIKHKYKCHKNKLGITVAIR